MLRTLIVTAVMFATTSTAALAQGRGQDRPVGRDTIERRDDLRDQQSLQALLNSFDSARARRDRFALAQVDQRMRVEVRGEVAELQRELAQDGFELQRVRRDARHGSREVREELRDVSQGRANLRRCEQIERELGASWGRVDDASLNARRALIVELIGLNRMELRQDFRR